MKIDRVILSTNENVDYYEFWPLVAQRWKKWGITPTLSVVSDKKLNINEDLGDVIYSSPIKDIPSAQQAQIIRLFTAAQFENDVCLISDLDMLPLKKEYFTSPLSIHNNADFLIYSSDAYLPGNPAYPAYPMCYLCSKGINFKNILEGNLKNFEIKLKEWMNHGFGWHTDEKVFYEKFQKWSCNNKKNVFLRRGFNISNSPLSICRIDRGDGCNYNEALLSKNFYIDFHMPRPYNQYKDIIDHIYKITDV